MTLQPRSVLGRLIVEVSRTRTHTHTHTHGWIPLDKWSPRRRGRYLHKTQQTQETKTYALSVIRTRDPQTHALDRTVIEIGFRQNTLHTKEANNRINFQVPFVCSEHTKCWVRDSRHDLMECFSVATNAGIKRVEC